MHRLSSALLAASLLGPAANSDTVPAGDRAVIEAAIQHYFRAGDTGDADELKLAFYPASIMYGYRNGTFVAVDQPEWQARLRKERTEGQPPMRANWRRSSPSTWRATWPRPSSSPIFPPSSSSTS